MQMKKLGVWETEMHRVKSQIQQKVLEVKKQRAVEESKHQLILKFALDVHKIVQTKDDKAYQKGVLSLNQEYVISENLPHDHKKKDLEPLEVLSNTFKQHEEALASLKSSLIKNNMRTVNDMSCKTKDNTTLIQDLNILKLEDKRQRLLIGKKEAELELAKKALARVQRDDLQKKAEFGTPHIKRSTSNLPELKKDKSKS